MACSYLEGRLGIQIASRPNEPIVGGRSLKEREEHQQYMQNLAATMKLSQELFSECQSLIKEVTEALKIAEDSNECNIAWEDVPLEDFPRVQEEVVAEEDSCGLPKYKFPHTDLWNEEVNQPSQPIIEVDPVLKEMLAEFRMVIEKNMLCRLQEIVNAQLKVPARILAVQKSSVLREAVQIRNQLQTVNKQIEMLGIRPKEPVRLQPLECSRNARISSKKRRKEAAVAIDPTRSKKDTPCILSITAEKLETQSTKVEMGRSTASSAVDIEMTNTLSSDVAKSLLRQAPRLNGQQADSLLRKTRWKSESCHQSMIESIEELRMPSKKHQLSVREADRLYNEAVISGARSDREIARRLGKADQNAKRRKKYNPNIERMKKWLFES